MLFKAWVAKFEVKMKSAAQKLLVLIQSKQATGGARPATAAAAPQAQAVKPAAAPAPNPGNVPHAT